MKLLEKMKLSEHFSLYEFLKTSTYNGKGLEYNCESFSSQIYNNLVRVANVLEQARAFICKPLVITSGYRCPKVNLAVRGGTNSDHLLGCAADISTVNLTSDEAISLAKRFRQYSDVRYVAYNPDKSYIHVSIYTYSI